MHGLGIYTGRSSFLCLQERMVVSVFRASILRSHCAIDWRAQDLFLSQFCFSHSRERENTSHQPTLFNKEYSSFVNDIALCIWLFLPACVFNVLLKNATYVRNSHKHAVGLLTPKYTFAASVKLSKYVHVIKIISQKHFQRDESGEHIVG